jgi:hypothetical protein
MSSDKSCYVERNVTSQELTIKGLLEQLASHMAGGDFTPSNAAVLIFSDSYSGIITIVNWGDNTAELLRVAHEVKSPNA